MRTLIERVNWIVEIVRDFVHDGKQRSSLQVQRIAVQLENFLPAMRVVVAQATRAAIHGEKVPARVRVFSIFEAHTELIKRGRRHKPVEFGHAVLLCQTREKFITDYDAFEEKPADCSLTGTIIERHRKLFGAAPDVLAGDKGFCPSAEEYAELEEEVETLAVPRRLRDLGDSTAAATIAAVSAAACAGPARRR